LSLSHLEGRPSLFQEWHETRTSSSDLLAEPSKLKWCLLQSGQQLLLFGFKISIHRGYVAGIYGLMQIEPEILLMLAAPANQICSQLFPEPRDLSDFHAIHVSSSLDSVRGEHCRSASPNAGDIASVNTKPIQVTLTLSRFALSLKLGETAGALGW
jgi:hypothetical protein